MNELRSGDRVRLKKTSEYYSQSPGFPGTVECKDGDGWVSVKWDAPRPTAKDGYPVKDLRLMSVGDIKKDLSLDKVIDQVVETLKGGR